MAVSAMALQQQENEDPATADLESSLSHAVLLRAPYIRKQCHQLTLNSVRRLLERDLGLRNLFLEEHKAVIKGLVDKVLNEALGDDDQPDALPEEASKRGQKNSRLVEDLGQNAAPEQAKKRSRKNPRVIEDLEDEDEELETPTVDGNGNTTRNSLNEGKEKPTITMDVADSEDEGGSGEKDRGQDAEMPDMQGSAIETQSENHGSVLQRQSKQETEALEDEGDAEEALAKKDNEETIRLELIKTNENAIRAALAKRAAGLKAQAETLTLTKVRDLLEDDLGMERDQLKVHKQFIRMLVDELLEAANEEPKIDQRDGEHETEEEAPVKSEGRPKSKESKSSAGRKIALGEAIEDSEENLQGNGEVSDSVSEERRPSKLKKHKKKNNEVKTKTVVVHQSIDAKRPFSAKVERLREILKFVGIGVSPILYKKAKQAPEHEREEVLIKELENRLAQEGLSSNPTEKDMKKVKARLEKKKDLDGIERSNIVEAPRRSRAAANSWFAPRPNRYAQATVADSEDEED